MQEKSAPDRRRSEAEMFLLLKVNKSWIWYWNPTCNTKTWEILAIGLNRFYVDIWRQRKQKHRQSPVGYVMNMILLCPKECRTHLACQHLIINMITCQFFSLQNFQIMLLHSVKWFDSNQNGIGYLPVVTYTGTQRMNEQVYTTNEHVTWSRRMRRKSAGTCYWFHIIFILWTYFNGFWNQTLVIPTISGFIRST